MKPVITFDFDWTLTKAKVCDEGFWWSSNTPNKPMLRHLNNMSKSFDVKIVTSRSSQKLPEVLQFVENHKLPVSDVIATNGEDKALTLKELKSVIHFDDDEVEIKEIEKLHPDCSPILITPVTDERSTL